MTNSMDIPFGVGVIVVTDGKILIGTRTDNGLICGPGGHIQNGEQPSESALRELQEEFNIKANKLYPLGAIQDTEGKWKPSMVFLCTDYEGEPKADEEEMTDARFAGIAELSQMDNLFPCFAASLALLMNKLEMNFDGGPGSGNWGHQSVQGVRGGSAPRSGAAQCVGAGDKSEHSESDQKAYKNQSSVGKYLDNVCLGSTFAANIDGEDVEIERSLYGEFINNSTGELYKKKELEKLLSDDESMHGIRAEVEKLEARESETYESLHTTISEIPNELVSSNIQQVEFGRWDHEPTEQEIIHALGGEDDTGSCVSLALAYAANKAGMEVEDFRGGTSKEFFKESLWMYFEDPDISSKIGVETTVASEKEAIDFVGKSVYVGEEHILAVGEHAAVIRKTEKGNLEYLELQGNEKQNGWHWLNESTLSERFCSEPMASDEDVSIINIAALSQLGGGDELEIIGKCINTKARTAAKTQDGEHNEI